MDGDPGAQVIAIEKYGCLYDFMIIHEVLHALGFFHEHQRPDRDDFVQIIMDNVIEGRCLNALNFMPAFI